MCVCVCVCVFRKDGFGIKKSMKIDKPLNKETKQKQTISPNFILSLSLSSGEVPMA